MINGGIREWRGLWASTDYNKRTKNKKNDTIGQEESRIDAGKVTERNSYLVVEQLLVQSRLSQKTELVCFQLIPLRYLLRPRALD